MVGPSVHLPPSSISPYDFSDGIEFDVLIVGGGIAGSSLAYGLGRNGFKVAVIERDLREPDRIVGELLQPGGVLKLKNLGLESCLEGIDGIDVYGYAVIMQDERQCLKYPLHEGQAVLGKSFHHGRFVQRLRLAAASVPNVKFIQGTVTQLLEDEAHDAIIGLEFKEDNEKKQLYAPLTVVCDGCASNLRKGLGFEKATTDSHFVGLILEDCHLPFPQHGHVFLAEPSPILGYQIGSNETRVLVDVPEPLPTGADLVEFLKMKTAPQLPIEIREAFLASLSSGKIRKMPNSKLHPNESYLRKGVVCVGDSWNMRHPLTGGGMTVALSDVVILRDVISSVRDLRDYTKMADSIQTFFVQRKPMASTINILAFALYQVFCSPNTPKWPSMRNACYGYFMLGGNAVKGPMSLLSGLCPNPFVLLYHFFLVAMYGVYQSLKPFPTPARIFHAYKLLSTASWMVIPLMRGEKIFKPFTTLLSFLFVDFNKSKASVSKVVYD